MGIFQQVGRCVVKRIKDCRGSARADWKKALGPNRENSLPIILLERLVAILLQVGQSFSIRYWLTGLWPPRLRHLVVEAYVLVALLIVVTVLRSGWTHLWICPLEWVIAYLLAEGYVASLAVILIPDDDGGFGIASTRRALILLVLNYVTIAVGFAAIYRLSANICILASKSIANAPTDLLYFSIVTITTLGYGDMVPISKGGRLLVASEAMAGIFLLVLILAAILPELQIERQRVKKS
jgi:hypothetical protein